MLVKFDAVGQARWAVRYDGGGADNPYYSFDSPNPVLDIDTAGNIYLSGQSSNGSSADFVTLKYSPDGIVLWERRFDGGSTDGVAGIKVDPSGNVVVTGYSCEDFSNSCFSNYLTVKYNAQGDLLWSNRYDHQGKNDIATALGIDPAGNVYVTGRSRDGDYYDYATVKYSPDGKLQWVGRYNATTSDQAEDVLVDGAGNVFVSGKSRNNSAIKDYDFVVVKYATTDQPLVDLVMTAVSTPGVSVAAGNSFTIDNTEKNQGTANMTVSSNTVKFYLSVDNMITSGDIPLTGTRSVPVLAAGESSNASTMVTVPTSVAAGIYFIGAIADATNMQPESNQAGNAEINNALAGGTITVLPDVDLVMTAVSSKSNNVRVGKSITLSNTIKNQGRVATTAGSTVGIYLSKLSTATSVDTLIGNSTLIGSRVVTSLAAGEASVSDTIATIPRTLASGTYYLWVVADKDKSQPETNEDNNTLVKTGTIKINP